MSLDWLLESDASYVLTTDEIQDILDGTLLSYGCGLDTLIAKERKKNIDKHKKCIKTRKYCGLCQYDPPERVRKVIDELKECQIKRWDQAMIRVCRTTPWTSKQFEIIDVVKSMYSLLSDYRALIKECRLRDDENKQLKKKRNGCKVIELMGRLSSTQCLEYLTYGYVKENASNSQYSRYPFYLKQITHKYLVTEDFFHNHKCCQ